MTYLDPEKQRRYQRERVARIRAEWLREHGPCRKCGSTEDLEVDHIDPATKVEHKVWSWSAVRRAAELAKCQVLCAACHRAKTIGDHGHNVMQHGTLHCYRKFRCRCTECRAAKMAEKKRNGWK